MPTERRLAAIMFTDIVGSTAVTARSEPAGLALRDRHRELVRGQVDRYHGRFIEAPGDECLATFESALDSVNCALAIQQELEDASDLKVRIGIHLGETVFRGDEVFGDGVNIAARIIALAEPAEIYVSAEVADALRNQPNLELSSRGEHQLKNVGRPVAVFRVQGTPGAPGSAKRRVDPGDSKGIRSLAVLPLENLSGDPEQEYFADGMTEAVISEFARIGSLSVISRTSVMQYKETRKPLPEIAQELGVDGIVEGTVMRAGDRVRITVQLVDARSDHHLWADNYDRDLSDVLALYSEVARAVAEQIRIKLTPEEQAALTAPRPVDPRAYDTYLRGLQLQGPRHLVATWGLPAIQRLEQAVKLDPDFAEGWAGLAQARLVLGGRGDLRYRDELQKARDAAQRALEIDERLGSAHLVLGLVQYLYDWDFVGAISALDRAMQLSPSDPGVLHSYATHVLSKGRTEEALEVAERIRRVAPFDLISRAQLIRFFFFARQYQRGLQEIERVRELDPDFVDQAIWDIYTALGRFEEAHQAHIELFKRGGSAFERTREAIERGWAEGGWEGSQRALLDTLTETEGPSPGMTAVVCALVGDKDRAFDYLERAYQERDPQILNIREHPHLDSIRSDPRYDDLVRRIGFPET